MMVTMVGGRVRDADGVGCCRIRIVLLPWGSECRSKYNLQRACVFKSGTLISFIESYSSILS